NEGMERRKPARLARARCFTTKMTKKRNGLAAPPHLPCRLRGGAARYTADEKSRLLKESAEIQKAVYILGPPPVFFSYSASCSSWCKKRSWLIVRSPRGAKYHAYRF